MELFLLAAGLGAFLFFCIAAMVLSLVFWTRFLGRLSRPEPPVIDVERLRE